MVNLLKLEEMKVSNSHHLHKVFTTCGALRSSRPKTVKTFWEPVTLLARRGHFYSEVLWRFNFISTWLQFLCSARINGFRSTWQGAPYTTSYRVLQLAPRTHWPPGGGGTRSNHFSTKQGNQQPTSRSFQAQTQEAQSSRRGRIRTWRRPPGRGPARLQSTGARGALC